MNKKTKKGFTIVELVIVIAVIAILAAVLIPTFSNVIQKAKISKDTQLIRNLNTALAVDGKQHNTMHEAIIAAEAFGYNLEKIDASATDNKILWDSKNDVFCYLVKDGETTKVQYIPDTMLKVKEINEGNDYVEGKVNKVDYWMIANRIEVQPQYSIYAGPEFSDPNHILDNLKEGFDAGSRTDISSIKYTGGLSAQSVVIRTNGGELTINAANDNVAHFGEALGVNIIAVKSESYHEHGTVLGNVEIASGRIEVASDAKVGTILVSSATTGAVKVDVASGAKIGTVAPTTESAKEDIAASATIPAESKQEEIVDKAVASKFAGGLGTETSPYLIATTEQLFNVGDFANIVTSFKLINDISVTADDIGEKSYISASFVGTLDGDNHSITFVDDTIYFAQYSGLLMTSSGNYIKPTYYKNLTIYNQTGEAGLAFVWQSYHSWFKNVNFGDASVPSEYELSHSTNNQGGYIAFCWYYGIFENCTNYYNHSSAMEDVGISPFIAGYGDNNGTTKGASTRVQFVNCVNYGTITGAHVGLFVANDQLMDNWTMFEVTNCANYGSLIGYKTAGIVGRANSNVYKNSNDYAVTGLASNVKIVKDATLAITANEEGYLVITKATNVSTVSYSISYTVYTAHYEKNAEGEFVKNGSSKVTIQIELPDIEFVDNKATTTLKKYKVMDYNTYVETYGELVDVSWNTCTAAIGTATYAIDTANDIIVLKVDAGDSDYITVNTTASTAVSIFDGEDNLLGIAVAK